MTSPNMEIAAVPSDTADDGATSFALHDLAKALQEVRNVPIRTLPVAPKPTPEVDLDTIPILVKLVEADSRTAGLGSSHYFSTHQEDARRERNPACVCIPAGIRSEQQLREYVQRELLADFAFMLQRFPGRNPPIPDEGGFKVHELRIDWQPLHPYQNDWDHAITDHNIATCIRMMQRHALRSHPPCVYAFVDAREQEAYAARKKREHSQLYREQTDENNSDDEAKASKRQMRSTSKKNKELRNLAK